MEFIKDHWWNRFSTKEKLLFSFFLVGGLSLCLYLLGDFLLAKNNINLGGANPLVLFIFALLVSFSISWGLQKVLIKPILILEEKIKVELFEKEKNGLKEEQSRDELVRVIRYFDHLSASICQQEKNLKFKNQRLVALNAIATACAQSLNLDEILQHILDTVLETTQFQIGGIYLYDEQNEVLNIRAWKGAESEQALAVDKIKLGEGFVGRAVEKREIIFVKDVSTDSRLTRTILKDEGIHSLLALPMLARGKVFGALVILGREFKEFTVEDNEFLDSICQQLGLTLDNLKLFSSWDKKVKELSLILDVSNAFYTSLDIDRALGVLVEKMSQAIKANYGLITLLDESQKNLVVKAGVSPDEKLKVSLTGQVFDLVSLDHFHQAIEQTKILGIRFDENKKLSLEERKLLQREKLSSVLLIPLAVNQRVSGVAVLGFDSKERPDIEKVNLCLSMASQAALAVENAKLYKYLNERVNELTTLYNVGQSLISVVEEDELLNSILKVIVNSFGYSNCAILLVDESEQNLYVRASLGYPQEKLKELKIKIGKQGITGFVAKTGEPLLVNDVSQDSRYIQANPDTKSEIALPLKVKDKIIGVLDAESKWKNAFTEKDLRILSQLASQIAVALENSRMFKQEKKRFSQLHWLNQVGKKVLLTLDLNEILSTVSNILVDNFKYDHVSLLLWDEKSEELVLRNQTGIFSDMVKDGWGIKKGTGLVGKSFVNGKTSWANDVSLCSFYLPIIPQTKSEISVPVKSGAEILGVLDVQSTRLNAFDQQDILVLETLADFLAISLSNFKLYQEIKEKAERLEITEKINRAISSTLDLESIFKIAASNLKNVIKYDRMSIAHFLPEENCFKVGAVFVDSGKIKVKAGKIIPADDTAMFKVVKEKKAFINPALSLDSSYFPLDRLLYAEGIRSTISIPILSHGEVIAVMNLGSRENHRFSEKDIPILESVTGHLAVALKNAKFYSDLQEAYKDLLSTQEKMVQTEKLRALGELAGGVAHDFNNILALILGRTQLLLKKFEKIETVEHKNILANLKIIEKATTDGGNILARIHEFSKMREETHFGLVSLKEILVDCIELTEAQWKDKAVSKGLEIDLVKDLNDVGVILGNPTELREAFTNVIINAVDSMPKGGKLILQLWQEHNEVWVRISDTGMGISAEAKKRIFEPFFTTKGNEGTGLGLSIVYGIISRHKAEISVESAPNQGTSFTFKFPLAEKDFIPQEEKSEKQNTQFSPARILIIDDEESLLDILEEMLSSVGHTIRRAENGMDGLELFQKEVFDIVITDLGMPKLSGWEVAAQIKALKPKTKIILSTGWGVQIEEEKLEEKNIDAVIHKPFNLNQILDLVGSLLNRKEKVENIENA